jgi:multidrug efflux pump subunit AcrA (membrane-fusion protein)
MLMSGMNATVEIVIADEPDALVIPATALQEPPAGAASLRTARPAPVVLVKSGSNYAPREIRTGRTDYRVVEVLEGLAEGDVLGIPMVSRLKQEHDETEARIRDRQTFGPAGNSGGSKGASAGAKPAGGGT